MNYKQLTYEQRCQIEALKKRGDTQKAIANVIGVSQSTISREFKRNTGKRGYRQKQAENKARIRKTKARKFIKMTRKLIATIEQKLSEKLSPEQISGWLMKAKNISISHERIYLYIWENKKSGGNLYQHLRRQGKKYLKRSHGKTTRGQIKNRVSIDQRPQVIDNKGRIGDWEIDTVIGKGHSGVLVTIVERCTKYTLTARVADKTARSVTNATIALLNSFKNGLVYSITADNGKEFAYHEEIAKALNAEFYFAHPYRSCERGLNENTNGLLRQYWPKSTDFNQVANDEVNTVVKQLNQRPRKTLGYETPETLMYNAMAALAA